ncbi:hypothetical protein GCM10007918_40240 [Piscinibacter gummiphilus]|nr:hypothetical protein GCM10007918_40240 [Piscinibacter gummiphilus]
MSGDTAPQPSQAGDTALVRRSGSGAPPSPPPPQPSSTTHENSSERNKRRGGTNDTIKNGITDEQDPGACLKVPVPVERIGV